MATFQPIVPCRHKDVCFRLRWSSRKSSASTNTLKTCVADSPSWAIWLSHRELYARQGNVSKLSDIEEIRKVVSKVPDAQVMTDLDATVAWVKASGQGNVEKLGITGFCWGGRIVWLYAEHSAQLRAGVAWYGRLVGKASELQPKHPIDIAARLKAPVLGLYGGNDQGIPLETVEQMRTELKAANSSSSIIVYPDAPHAFYADYRASYRKEPAEDGWRRLHAWFKKHDVT